MIFDPLQNVRARAMRPGPICLMSRSFARAKAKVRSTSCLRAKREGLVYHMCYRSRRPGSIIGSPRRAMAACHVYCVSPPKEAVLFGGKRVSFYLIEGVGLIEIIDEAP